MPKTRRADRPKRPTRPTRPLLALFAAAALLAPGCRGGLDCQVAQAIRRGWAQVGPRYVEYVEADQGISDELRAERLKHAEALGGVIVRLEETACGGD